MVIAPASTGKLSTNKKAVTPIHQEKRFMVSSSTLLLRIAKDLTKKLILPKIELIPATWSLRMAASTDTPL